MGTKAFSPRKSSGNSKSSFSGCDSPGSTRPESSGTLGMKRDVTKPRSRRSPLPFPPGSGECIPAHREEERSFPCHRRNKSADPSSGAPGFLRVPLPGEEEPFQTQASKCQENPLWNFPRESGLRFAQNPPTAEAPEERNSRPPEF